MIHSIYKKAVNFTKYFDSYFMKLKENFLDFNEVYWLRKNIPSTWHTTDDIKKRNTTRK